MRTVRALAGAEMLAHEGQMAYLLPWNVTFVLDENRCMRWHCHEQLCGKTVLTFWRFGCGLGRLGFGAFFAGAFNTSSQFLREFHGTWRTQWVNVAADRAFRTGLTAVSQAFAADAARGISWKSLVKLNVFLLLTILTSRWSVWGTLLRKPFALFGQSSTKCEILFLGRWFRWWLYCH